MKLIRAKTLRSILCILLTISPFIYQQSYEFPNISRSSQVITIANNSQSPHDHLFVSSNPNYSKDKRSTATTLSSIETHETPNIDGGFRPWRTSQKLHLSHEEWIIFNNLDIMDLLLKRDHRIIFDARHHHYPLIPARNHVTSPSTPSSTNDTFLPGISVSQNQMEVQLMKTWLKSEDTKLRISTNAAPDTTFYIGKVKNCTQSPHDLSNDATDGQKIKFRARKWLYFQK